MNEDLYVYFEVDDTSNCTEHEHGNQVLCVYIGNNPFIGCRFIPKNWGVYYQIKNDHTGCCKCGYRKSYYNFEIVPQKAILISKSYKDLYDLYYYQQFVY